MRFFEGLSIRHQLFIFIFVVLLMILTVNLISYQKVEKVFKSKNDEYSSEIIYQVEKNFTNHAEIINKVTKNIAYNPSVQEFLLADTEKERYKAYKETILLVNNMKSIKEGILDVIIIGDNGALFYQKKSSDPFIPELIAQEPRIGIYYSELQDFGEGKVSIPCFVVEMAIISVAPDNRYNEGIGRVFTIVDAGAFLGRDGDMTGSNSSNLVLIDREGNVFMNNDVDLEPWMINQRHEYNGEEWFALEASLPYVDGKIISIVPREDLLFDLDSIKSTQLFATVLLFLLLGIPLGMISVNIIRPLNEFKVFTSKLQKGDLRLLKGQIELGGYREMSELSMEFNGMLSEINSLTQRLVTTTSRLYETELEKRRAELEQLRSQVNPHFLYNTLESIKAMAYRSGDGDVIQMVKALGAVFRYSSKAQDEVSLYDEIEVVKSYLHIQKVRFANRFEVEYMLCEEVLEQTVPKMILQPIVENAIFHGLEPLSKNGKLSIIGHVSSDRVFLIVEDNGTGIPEDAMPLDRDECVITDGDSAGVEKKIGVLNVHRRLQLLYGHDYGLKIHSKEGAGTKVIYELPRR